MGSCKPFCIPFVLSREPFAKLRTGCASESKDERSVSA